MRTASIAAGVLLLVASCQDGGRRDYSGPAREYRLEGAVVRVDARRHTATIKHGPIHAPSGELWMEAMTMEYPVPSPEDLAKLRRGMTIRATVHARESDDEYWLSGISEVPARSPVSPTGQNSNVTPP